MNGLALCAGVGGLELGLKLAMGKRYRTVCYVEREAFAASILVARMEDKTLDKAPIWDDLTTFDGRRWRGKVDIISAGFPCQPFSVAGKRRGMDDERWLWADIARIIRDVNPRIAFFENVPGLIHHGLKVIWRDLQRMGYGVQAGLFSAAEVGAPHRRQRLFILANNDEYRCVGEGLHIPQWGQDETVQNTDGTSKDVAHTGCLISDRKQSRGSARSCWPYPPDFGGTWQDVENTANERLEGWEQPKTTWPLQRESPPSSWPRGLEPAIRGMADGLPNRVDQLRALGNGVVPLVAAHAWRILNDQPNP